MTPGREKTGTPGTGEQEGWQPAHRGELHISISSGKQKGTARKKLYTLEAPLIHPCMEF